MSDGLDKTFELLAKTKNESAVGVLIPALDSPHEVIRERALAALVDRRSPAGHRELVRRWHTIGEHQKLLISERPWRMSEAIRDAVLDTDPQVCANGCEGALWFREYDLVPTLINAVEDESNPNVARVARTLTRLIELLYDELSGPRDYRIRRDPQFTRRHVVASLESSVVRFGKHGRVEVVEAFLLLVKPDNLTLKKILRDPHDKGYRPVVEIFFRSERQGVMRLLLSFLDNPQAPSSTMKILARRCDEKFLRHLLKQIGTEPSASAKVNLKRMDSIAWAQGDLEILDALDDAAQYAAVQLVMFSGMQRLEIFKVIRYLLSQGKVGGRRAAAASLAEFRGAEANKLSLQSLHDADPYVQASALAELRQRGIPGAITRLIESIDSPHEIVQKTARQSLGEFRFDRYLAAFDMLDEEVRTTTGTLVKKVDLKTIPALAAEMRAQAFRRRFRALAVAQAIDAVGELETDVVRMLAEDKDHLVRSAAASTLSSCNTPTARQGLRDALTDPSPAVQDAAERSLKVLIGAAGQMPQDTAQPPKTTPMPTVPGNPEQVT